MTTAYFDGGGVKSRIQSNSGSVQATTLVATGLNLVENVATLGEAFVLAASDAHFAGAMLFKNMRTREIAL